MADPVETAEQVRARRPAITSTTGTTSRPKPLGVPEYVMGPDGQPTPYAVPGGIQGDVLGVPIPSVPILPHFFDGDEWRPASLPPGQIARLQDLLAGVGLLDEYRRGYWDANSQKAYREVLEFANASGIGDEATAIRRIAETGGLGEVTKPRAPLTVRRSNPLDIKKGADDVARSVLGRKLRDDELPTIISAIQALETQAQTQAYNADATVVEPPSLAAFVEQKLRVDNPVEARTQDELGVGNEFFDLLSGGGS